MTDAKIILLIRLHVALLPTAAARQIFDGDCYAAAAVLSHNIFWSVPVTEHNRQSELQPLQTVSLLVFFVSCHRKLRSDLAPVQPVFQDGL